MKILLFANTDWYLFNYRLSLAQALVDAGHEVILLSPPGQYGRTLTDYGLDWQLFPLSRRGLNPISETISILKLASLYRQIKPDITHHFTTKCIIYGSFAAKMAGIPHIINAVTGRGYIYSHNDWSTAVARKMISPLYKASINGTEVIFQNEEDRHFFLGKKFIDEVHSHLIPGSGVDVDKFQVSPLPSGKPIILLPSRMLWSKGVNEFITAASIFRKDGLNALFVLVGEPDPGNPDSIPVNQLEEWDHLDNVEWWGWQDDMVKVFQKSTVVCLPSYYGEGLPKSLIEGAASGRPLVATDIPGCREVIRQGINGYLVPIKDGVSLAKAIEKTITDKDLTQQMGHNSRKIVECRYSTEIVNNATISIYNKYLKSIGGIRQNN